MSIDISKGALLNIQYYVQYYRNDGKPHPDLMAMSVVIQCSAGLVFMGTCVFGAKAAREAFLTKQHQVYTTKFMAQVCLCLVHYCIFWCNMFHKCFINVL